MYHEFVKRNPLKQNVLRLTAVRAGQSGAAKGLTPWDFGYPSSQGYNYNLVTDVTINC